MIANRTSSPASRNARFYHGAASSKNKAVILSGASRGPSREAQSKDLRLSCFAVILSGARSAQSKDPDKLRACTTVHPFLPQTLHLPDSHTTARLRRPRLFPAASLYLRIGHQHQNIVLTRGIPSCVRVRERSSQKVHRESSRPLFPWCVRVRQIGRA